MLFSRNFHFLKRFFEMAFFNILKMSREGMDLMSKDELAVMEGGKCIMQLRGVRPFLSDKYDLT